MTHNTVGVPKPQAETIFEQLSRVAAGSPAIGAPGRKTLTFEGLRQQIENTVSALNRQGVGRGDTVSIVLANGPEMATAFLATACGATAAPLNPAYREEEFEFFLNDLRPKLLLVESQSTSPACRVAKRLGIAIAQLRVNGDSGAGCFELSGEGAGPATPHGGFALRGDVALVLHTSGTTSRPKMVPLSQANLCAAAASISRTLALTPEDRCLNVMPLFHIHGLVAAVLSSLASGSSVVCTSGFRALHFFDWLAETRPSWYTAVPTMHQAILSRAPRRKGMIGTVRVRFVRSSSASLPVRVMRELEETFQAPVIEAYGMTEATHQMTSNPLPPGERKPGSVGVAAGPEVAIMDDAGMRLAAGNVGEVVIRGPSVTSGYLHNPQANAEAFTDGWFRTGDQGIMDREGYLCLTGRLKEIINRGGEKISPREIDEVLMEHPAVLQAVTFALPHDKLGEEVAVAVVLRPGPRPTEGELRRFVRERVAEFKVPRKVLFLDEIPRGPTGKLQRIGLAKTLGLVN